MRRLILVMSLALALVTPPSAARDCGPERRDGSLRGLLPNENAFPVGVWLQRPELAERYRAIGVNHYVGLWKGPTPAQLAQLRRAAMPVIGAPTAAARDPAAADVVVGWLHKDEPDNAQPLKIGGGYGPPIAPHVIQALYCEYSAIRPRRPVFLSLGQGVAWKGWFGRGDRTGRMEDYPRYIEGADAVFFNIYPVVSTQPEVRGRLELIGRGVERLRNWAARGQPAWAVIGVTRIGNVAVEPTPDDIRAQVWMAVAHGAQGIVYFVHQFSPTFDSAALLAHPENLAAVRDVNARLQRLAPVLKAPTVPEAHSGVRLEDGQATLLVKDVGEERYVFAVSTRAVAQTLRIRLGGAGQVEVLEEARRLERTGGVIEDRFRPYGFHIYRFGRSG